MTFENTIIEKNPEKGWWFGWRTVLLAEDNVMVHDLVSTILKKVGIRIQVCENGFEALSMVQAQQYDAVLMDIQMPIMDGVEATRKIRKLGTAWETLPIIALTANTAPADIELYLDVGMNDHLCKPIDRKVLYATLARWIPTVQENDRSAEQSSAYASETAFPSLDGIDTEDGLQRVAGNRPVYTRMLHNFHAHYLQSMADIEQHLQSGEFESLQRLTHSIKGNAGNLGAQSLHGCASKLEQACKLQSLQQAVSLLADFQRELERVLSSIAQLPPMEEKNLILAGSFNRQDWLEHVNRFIQLINTDLGAAMDGYTQLRQVSAGQYTAELKQLESSLHNFDAEAAKQVLIDIRNRCTQ